MNSYITVTVTVFIFQAGYKNYISVTVTVKVVIPKELQLKYLWPGWYCRRWFWCLIIWMLAKEGDREGDREGDQEGTKRETKSESQRVKEGDSEGDKEGVTESQRESQRETKSESTRKTEREIQRETKRESKRVRRVTRTGESEKSVRRGGSVLSEKRRGWRKRRETRRKSWAGIKIQCIKT